MTGGSGPMRPFNLAVLLVFMFFVGVLPASGQVPDFISIDCGGTSNFTDGTTGLQWIPDDRFVTDGKIAKLNISTESRQQYQTLRYFPADNKKYCYTLNTTERTRYLVRATFLYGNFDNNYAYPKFNLYLDATYWATVTVADAEQLYNKEMIFRAPSSTINVCILEASTGSPFISTLELRAFKGSMYATEFEDDFFLKVTARINFGARSKEPIRYPDDPYDRVWESDAIERPNYLVDVADGTIKVNTTKNIFTNTHEQPPNKVMQTAVVGTKGSLTYRLNLEDFPANARAYAYLAEIEDLGPSENRKFTLTKPYIPVYSTTVLNVKENAGGSYSLYEPSYPNASLPFVLSFAFEKTADSTRGPILNALEINRYVRRTAKISTQDAAALAAFMAKSPMADWANEGGDPCSPFHWDWVDCSSDSPPRITKIDLSGKNLTGEIPSDIAKLKSLVELRLDNNSLTGRIPDLSTLVSLAILHLENNKLRGPLPLSLADLPRLQELYVENNKLSGRIPKALLRRNMTFLHDGNPDLSYQNGGKNVKLIIGTTVGGFIILVLVIAAVYFIFVNYQKKSKTMGNNKKWGPPTPSSAYLPGDAGSMLRDAGTEIAYSFTLAEIEEATQAFSKKIGQGSFGPVYYGKTKDGKEIAVKILAGTSSYGARQFVNEVTVLSRVHHRNLVPLIGYCEEGGQSILVYEYMHNGTLRDHLHDYSKQGKALDWISRLHIAEDAAKGLEYLHDGCNPSIIHRDVKSSNILLDIHMRAKVSDFGLSRMANEDMTHISSVARGTVGYLDPEYYATQQLTEKSDIYSFGVVLLELISGRKPVSSQEFGADWNIVLWARSLIRKGDIHGIIDPALGSNFKVESIWKIAEVAILSVEPYGLSRPRMKDILQAIQEAIEIEKGNGAAEEGFSDLLPAHPGYASLLSGPPDNASSDLSLSLTDQHLLPTVR